MSSLVKAADFDIAVSNARGPSNIPPVICLRSAILHKPAASTVEAIFALTVSTADKIATLGLGVSSACKRLIAFCTISALIAKFGAILIAASVINNGLW